MASSEEKEQLVLNAKQKKLNQIADEQIMVEIQRSIPNQLDKRRPSIQKTHMKRTFSNMDHLPTNFKNEMIDGTYDNNLNLNEGKGYIFDCRKQKGNCVSWFFICIMLICVILILIGRINFPNDTGYWLLMFPICIVWILYSFEWRFISETYDYLDIAQYDADVMEYLNTLHESQARIVWTSQSFHYDRDKSEKLTKIITNENERIYRFETEDISAEIGFKKYELTKLNLLKVWTFGNDKTKNEYEKEFNAFCSEYNKDEYQRVHISMELLNYKSKILVNSAKGKRMKCWDIKYYSMFSCLCCSPCYRTVFNGNSGVNTHIIHKKIRLPMKEILLKTNVDINTVDL
eukprot:199200_1